MWAVARFGARARNAMPTTPERNRLAYPKNGASTRVRFGSRRLRGGCPPTGLGHAHLPLIPPPNFKLSRQDHACQGRTRLANRPLDQSKGSVEWAVSSEAV